MGLILAIWASKEGVAPMDYLLNVGENTRERVPNWPRLAEMFLNVLNGDRLFRSLEAAQK